MILTTWIFTDYKTTDIAYRLTRTVHLQKCKMHGCGDIDLLGELVDLNWACSCVVYGCEPNRWTDWSQNQCWCWLVVLSRSVTLNVGVTESLEALTNQSWGRNELTLKSHSNLTSTICGERLISAEKLHHPVKLKDMVSVDMLISGRGNPKLITKFSAS